MNKSQVIRITNMFLAAAFTIALGGCSSDNPPVSPEKPKIVKAVREGGEKLWQNPKLTDTAGIDVLLTAPDGKEVRVTFGCAVVKANKYLIAHFGRQAELFPFDLVNVQGSIKEIEDEAVPACGRRDRDAKKLQRQQSQEEQLQQDPELHR